MGREACQSRSVDGDLQSRHYAPKLTAAPKVAKAWRGVIHQMLPVDAIVAAVWGGDGCGEGKLWSDGRKLNKRKRKRERS